jgi:hypothetical protein
LAALMIFVQAGTGWRAAGEEIPEAVNESEEEREERIDGAENAA